jgi:outer membrane immunogenic protein
VNEAKAGIDYRFGGAALPPAAGASQHLLPPPRYDWTGCYAGVHAGGGIIGDTFVPNSSSGGGAVAGGQIGCNVQTGIMVFGLEGEAAWSNLTDRLAFNEPGAMQVASDRNSWSADIAARAGVAFDRALLYGKAGVSEGQFDFFEVLDGIPIFNGGANLTGLLLGLGMEYAFAPNWSAKLEYDHAGYLSRNIDSGSGSNNESATTDTVKAGVNYKFFGPSGAVVARD